MKGDMNRVFLLVAALFVHVALLGGSFFFWQEKFQAASLLPLQKEQANEDVLTLLFAGDIMLDRGVEWHMKENQNWSWPFLLISDTLKKADLVFANLESVVSSKGIRQGSIYSFRADPRSLEGLAVAGFDVLSVANNHSLDYGVEALLDSIQRLKEEDIIPVGGGINRTEAHKPAFLEVKDTKFAVLGYTQVGSPLWQAGAAGPGVAFMDVTKLSQLQEDIHSAEETADIVIVSFHFGKEYQAEPSLEQKLLSQSAIDYGADLVVGHHPHVVQPVERYKKGWVAYSLGNFVFDQGFSKETMEGLLLKVLVKQKSITEVTPVPVQLSPSFQPAISTESM